MKIKFIKMQGLGNDYIYFDCITQGPFIENPSETAKSLSDRHFGIGGDGIVLMLPHDIVDFEMRMYNADGSEGEMCGNAIRCIGKYVYEMGYTSSKNLQIETGAGVRDLTLVIDKKNEVSQVRVDMGAPILNGADIPVSFKIDSIIKEPILVGEQEFKMTCVSMGNPHCVIFVDEITDQLVLDSGPRLERHPYFPNRINVEFAKVCSRQRVEMRVWERGSGETMACGTGAAAVGVAAILNDLTDRKMTVHLKGGDLQIEWPDKQVFMTGPAEIVFTGEVDI